MLLRKWLFIGIITLFAVMPVYGQSIDTAFPIPPGSIEGNINDTFFSTFYSFEVVAEDVITIVMDATSGDLDPFTTLYSPNGDILLFNDDEPDSGSRNSRIDYTAESEGMLIIEATRFDRVEGLTSGTYRLTLSIEGASQVPVEIDPLTIPPTFAVDFAQIEYDIFSTGTLDAEATENYFVFGGRQGDFVRVTTTISDGNLRPLVTIRNEDATVISTSIQTSPTETSTLATIPEDGWYQIEVKRESGAGQFSLFATQLAQSVLMPDVPVRGELTETTPQLSFVFNGTINDTILARLELIDPPSNVQPRISVLNINQEVIAEFTSGSKRASVITELPRSGSYVVKIGVSGTAVGGAFSLRLQRSPLDVDKLDIDNVRYNESYANRISDRNPLHYYRFVGKVGELVTISMQANDTMALDSYLILLNSNLDELAFNDTAGSSSNARITQFALPENGEYYIIATRAGLLEGTTNGRYTLSLTVGQIELQTGVFTATLNWEGDADLNLFVREPSGRVISWSNPTLPSEGTLQIDSNTNCETPTSQPVEHIYYPSTVTIPNGNYTVWVWYQNVCSMDAPVPFSLTVTAYNQDLLKVENTLEDPVVIDPNQRFEAVLLVNQPTSTIITQGEFSSPSAQQSASQGGDTLIRYGETVSDTVQNDVYARFYQFVGEEGDIIAITVETQTGTLDPIVVLRTADDINLATNDDAESFTRNSRLDYTLPESGQYVIVVTRYGLRDGTTTGAYVLNLEKATD
jgi:hypothetical protein